MAGRTPQTYSSMQIVLHWIVAFMVLFQIVVHENMVSAWRAHVRGQEIAASDQFLTSIHVWGGVAIGVFAAWRLWLRFSKGVPATPESESPLFRLAASATHILLYVLMIGMPLTGIAAWFFGYRDMAELHEIARIPLIALVVVHVAGALAQKYWFKSDVMDRMIKMR